MESQFPWQDFYFTQQQVDSLQQENARLKQEVKSLQEAGGNEDTQMLLEGIRSLKQDLHKANEATAAAKQAASQAQQHATKAVEHVQQQAAKAVERAQQQAATAVRQTHEQASEVVNKQQAEMRQQAAAAVRQAQQQATDFVKKQVTVAHQQAAAAAQQVAEAQQQAAEAQRRADSEVELREAAQAAKAQADIDLQKMKATWDSKFEMMGLLLKAEQQKAAAAHQPVQAHKNAAAAAELKYHMLEQQLAEVQRSHDMHKEAAEKAGAQVKELKQRVLTMELSQYSTDAELSLKVSELEAELSRRKKTENEAIRMRNHLLGAVDEKDKKIEDQRKTAQETRSKLKQADKEVARLEHDLKAERNNMIKQSQLLNTALDKAASDRDRIKSLTAEVEELRAAKLKQESDLLACRNSNQRLQTSLTRAYDALRAEQQRTRASGGGGVNGVNGSIRANGGENGANGQTGAKLEVAEAAGKGAAEPNKALGAAGAGIVADAVDAAGAAESGRVPVCMPAEAAEGMGGSLGLAAVGMEMAWRGGSGGGGGAAGLSDAAGGQQEDADMFEDGYIGEAGAEELAGQRQAAVGAAAAPLVGVKEDWAVPPSVQHVAIYSQPYSPTYGAAAPAASIYKGVLYGGIPAPIHNAAGGNGHTGGPAADTGTVPGRGLVLSPTLSDGPSMPWYQQPPQAADEQELKQQQQQQQQKPPGRCPPSGSGWLLNLPLPTSLMPSPVLEGVSPSQRPAPGTGADGASVAPGAPVGAEGTSAPHPAAINVDPLSDTFPAAEAGAPATHTPAAACLPAAGTGLPGSAAAGGQQVVSGAEVEASGAEDEAARVGAEATGVEAETSGDMRSDAATAAASPVPAVQGGVPDMERVGQVGPGSGRPDQEQTGRGVAVGTGRPDQEQAGGDVTVDRAPDHDKAGMGTVDGSATSNDMEGVAAADSQAPDQEQSGQAGQEGRAPGQDQPGQGKEEARGPGQEQPGQGVVGVVTLTHTAAEGLPCTTADDAADMRDVDLSPDLHSEESPCRQVDTATRAASSPLGKRQHSSVSGSAGDGRAVEDERNSKEPRMVVTHESD